MTDEVKRDGKMTEEGLLGLIRQYEMSSLGSSVAAGATISTTIAPSNQSLKTLEIDRFDALNMYFARPLGNEVADRSQIVLPELRDTIEWIMPQLMRMFVSAKTVCRFEPENQNDEAQAEEETIAVNHIFMQENNGFFVMHDFFKDAMLMRNGYAEVDWREKQDISVERYTGVTEMELPELLQEEKDATVEVLEQREYQQQIRLPIPQTGPQGLPPGMPPPQIVMPVTLFDLKIRRKAKKGSVCVTCIPPEEMRVTPRAREGMEDIAFAMHITNKARTDLIAEGFDKELVEMASAGRPNWLEIDALARNQTVDQLTIDSPADRAMQELECRRVIMRVDFDGDGLAELRRIVVVGDKIAENEVIEETPFASCVPKRMPHRHTGVSLYDEIADLQVLKTELFRQGIDNLKISNNQRTAVDYQSANFDDLLTSRPGGVVRGKGPPSNWIMPIPQPSNLVEQVLPVMGYLDEMKTSRTGIGKGQMSPDPDELQDVTKGAQLAAMSAAALKVEMLARLLAEGVKDIFRKIHSELIRHQDKPLEFEVSGKWIQVDPSSWRRRTKVVANVGLGSGNREEMRTNVQLLTQAQMALAQMGLVGPKQGYETFKLLVEALGFNSPERFAMDPASPEYAQHMQEMANQPPPPNPQLQVEQVRAQTEIQKQEATNQREVMKLQGELAQAKLQLVHEAIQNQNDRMHEQQQALQDQSHEHLQGHKDREVALDTTHAQITQTLIKAFAQIIASQLKGDPSADGGAELGKDVKEADSEIEGNGKLQGLIDGMHNLVQTMGKPKTATLSDGRQIKIE